MPRRKHVGPAAFLENTGPQDLAELAKWDDFIVDVLRRAGLAGRVVEVLRSGAVMYSDYSGIDFPRESEKIIVPAVFKSLDIQCPIVEHVRSCDWGLVQLFALRRSSRLFSECRSCVFGDLSEIAVILVNKIGGGLVDEVGGLPAKLSTCW